MYHVNGPENEGSDTWPMARFFGPEKYIALSVTDFMCDAELSEICGSSLTQMLNSLIAGMPEAQAYMGRTLIFCQDVLYQRVGENACLKDKGKGSRVQAKEMQVRNLERVVASEREQNMLPEGVWQPVGEAVFLYRPSDGLCELIAVNRVSANPGGKTGLLRLAQNEAEALSERLGKY